jgi:hypothetical protein
MEKNAGLAEVFDDALTPDSQALWEELSPDRAANHAGSEVAYMIYRYPDQLVTIHQRQSHY